MTGTTDMPPGTGTAERPEDELSAWEARQRHLAQMYQRHPWMIDLVAFVRVGLAVAAWAVLRLAYTPPPLITGAAWAALATMLGWLGARREYMRPFERNRWLNDLVMLIRFGLLAAAGAVLRLAYVPSFPVAGAAWAALAAALGWWLWVREPLPEPGGWQPGDPYPAGIPAAAMEAMASVLAAASFPVWLTILRCPGPGKHDWCQRGYAVPVRGGILVAVGEHLTERPARAAFVAGHELLHLAGWRRRLWVVATYLRLAGWLIAGWALPWPQALAAIAAVQAAYNISGWVLEIACDVGSARVTGAEAALDAFAARREELREPSRNGIWMRAVGWTVKMTAGHAPHPPLRVRCAMIRAMVRT